MICISSPLAANLAEHLAGRTEGYLFRTETGEPWDSNKVRDKKLNRILERAGIPKIDEKLLATIVANDKTIAQATRSEVRQASLGLHSFRHTNATAMDSQHIPKGVQKKRLGHSARDTTALYTHAFPQDERLRQKSWASFSERIGRNLNRRIDFFPKPFPNVKLAAC